MSKQKHSYTLHYFDTRGRGELIRLMFVYHNVTFEDHRISMDDWPTCKPEAPMGQVPYLVVDDGKLIICQTLSICRYLAKSLRPEDYFGGETKSDSAKCDMYADTFMDLFSIGVGAAHEKDPIIKEKKETIFENQYPVRLRMLEHHLKNNGGHHFVSRKVLWCDLVALCVLSILEEIKPNILQDFPDIQLYYINMRNLPEIKDYVKNNWPPATV
ncbi:glutathione S-transferase protein [Dictyocaulus viviparus]|uniref:Glutathione S-transferase protein n=1 Tax=Dictyocaulus viviparus TaxID=29172 RepID=A0A0D8XBA7_DICVI|nr:glutathione S-transferase protein [Dictyocaulus viviparus]